jgi:HAD superfamily hydrolase (TIGR01509 family)
MKILITDFSRVLIFPIAENVESLNRLHQKLSLDSNYNIFDHFILNHELLSYLEQLKNKLPVYIFTDGRLHELPEVSVHLKDIFKETYSVDTLGLDKKKTEAYGSLASRIGVDPSDIIFVDDKPANVEAAKRAGVNAIQYISNGALVQKLETLFSK